MNTTKLSYAMPRPLWVNPAVLPFHCSSQFGNPSGHAMTCLSRPLQLWLDLNKNVREGVVSKLWFRLLLLALCLAFAGSIFYSRLFLGVHSLD